MKSEKKSGWVAVLSKGEMLVELILKKIAKLNILEHVRVPVFTESNEVVVSKSHPV